MRSKVKNEHNSKQHKCQTCCEATTMNMLNIRNVTFIEKSRDAIFKSFPLISCISIFPNACNPDRNVHDFVASLIFNNQRTVRSYRKAFLHVFAALCVGELLQLLTYCQPPLECKSTPIGLVLA